MSKNLPIFRTVFVPAKMRVTCLALFVFLFVSLRSFAQTTEGVFRTEHLGTKDGLSNRWTMCVLQDTKGYIWVGTYDGLNRYDGNDFIVYRPSAKGKFPVSADLIVQLAETTDGKILLGTRYGILRFDPETGIFDLLVKSGGSHTVLVLNTGSGDPLLTADGGNSGTLRIYEMLPSGKLAPLTKEFQSPGGGFSTVQCDWEAIWFWDSKGSYHRLSLKDQTWSRLPVAGSKEVPIDASGILWIPNGLDLLPFPLPANKRSVRWNRFNLEPHKAVWLYTTDSQAGVRLIRYDLKNGNLKTIIPSLKDEELIEYGIAQPFYPRQCMDDQGTVWLTGFQGLTKVRYTDNLFRHYLSKPVVRIESPTAGTSARQLAEDAAGNIYVQDAQGGFYKIDPVSGTAAKIKLPRISPGNDEKYRVLLGRALDQGSMEALGRVNSVISDPDGSIWFSTLLGLFHHNPATGQFHHFFISNALDATLFANGNDSILWVTNQESYSVDKRSGGSRRLTGLHYEQLYYGTMLPEEQILWGFTDTGLVKINTRTLDTKYISLYDEPREQRCLVSHRGWLWVGTSRGLEKINPKTFAHTNFDRSKGLPGNFVYNMVADGDYLWLGTSDGLCRFNVKTGAVKNFYVEDGLSHNEFNTPSALKARNGRIFMGGLNGVNAFLPAELEQKTTVKSRTLLSRYSLFDTDKDSLLFFNVFSLPEKIELPPSVTSLNLHLALSSYLDPSKNQYAWRLDGLDEDWYYAGDQHVASYRHLSPGSYTFRAKAADPFGNWSENELTLHIVVQRPWYSRWWAWLLYLLAAGSAIYLLYRNQLSKRMEHAENRRLQELDEFRRRFFTNITHEFRTPLTVILGMTEKLETDVAASGHPVTNAVSLIKRNGQNLLRLINQILDLAKLESNALKINYVQGDVLSYLRYITESLHSYANAQNVMVRVDSKEAEIAMDYDPERLLQIVHNLLSNAIKFTPSGGRVLLRVTSDLAGLKNLPGLTLTVTDNGVGIPPEDLPNIFDRFYQANNLEKAKAGGTGIGLALSKELVKAMGGEISVESEVGKGTTFVVRLPITNKATVSDGVTSSPEIAAALIFPKETSASRKAVRQDAAIPEGNDKAVVLLIEDNPDVVEYLIICLDDHYQLDYAYNGRAGIEKALETVPDLIISDVMMPEKDGFEVCETLKNDERTSHIPIILLTARADAASRIAGLRRGADAYLSKPFHREELLAQLQVLAEKQRRIAAWLSRKAHNENPPQFPEAVAEEDILVEDAFIQKLRNIVAENYTDEGFGLPQLCQKIGMSRSQLFRKMTALIATSPSDFIRSYRLNEAKKLLETTDLNVSEVAWQCGFVNLAHFSKVYQEEFGMAPSATNK